MNINEVYELIPADGWLTKPEATLLVKHAGQTAGTIVEVGSYQGRSAVLFANLWRPVVCVDPWADGFHDTLGGDQIYARFLANVAGYPLVIPVRCRVEDWEPVLAGFVYLDGDHTYAGTKAQLRKALECNPARIAVHDVNDSGGGAAVKRACLEVLGPWAERVERVAVWRLR